MTPDNISQSSSEPRKSTDNTEAGGSPRSFSVIARLSSAVQRLLIRTASLEALLPAVCRLFVETGGYPISWVGATSDSEFGTVSLVASAGLGEWAKQVYVDQGRDVELHHQAFLRAMQTRQPALVRGFRTSADSPPWSIEAVQKGCTGFVALPLVVADDLLGLLIVGVADDAHPDDAALGQLAELARDVAHRWRELSARSQPAVVDRHTHTSVVAASSTVYDQVPVMYVVTKAVAGKPVIVDCNQLFLDSLGYARKDVIGRVLTDFYSESSQRALLEGGYQQALETGIIDVERELVRRDGHVLPTMLRALPILDEAGMVTGTGAAYIDVSARKRVETALAQRVEERTAELRHATELQRAILSFAGTAIISTGLDGTVRTFNPAAERMLGYAAEEVIGKVSAEVFHDPQELILRAVEFSTRLGEQIEPGFDVFVACTRQGLPNECEWTFVGKNGTRIPVLLSVAPVRDEGGAILGYVGMASDITIQKRVEENLRQSEEKMREANAEMIQALKVKDEFLANMSHELRTPLNAIISLSETLAEELIGPLNKRQRKFNQTIIDSGHHLLTLINDILDLSKIEAGRTELKIAPIDIEALCMASIRLVKEQAQKKRLALSLKVDDQVTTVQADVRRLKQMLVNLLSNAVKFTQESGQVGLEVRAEPELARVSLTVWDTGIGINRKDLPHLFQSFVQLDSKRSREYGGTGLGLVLVARMARMHGGSVHVESAPGRGSRFTIGLPWESDRLPKQQEQPQIELPRQPASAMIVESAAHDIDHLAHFLRERQITVHVVEEESALEQAAHLRPDVVFLNLALSDAEKWAQLNQLKSDPRTMEIPVVVTSVVNEREQARKLGAAAYLLKPFDRSGFEESLLQVLAHEPEVAPRWRAPLPSCLQREHAAPVEATILLVEETESVIRAVVDSLADVNCRLIVARNGMEGVAYASELHPDVILVCVQMSGMDGLEMTRYIRAEPSLRRTPIIALSSLIMPGDRERCFSVGMDDYLTKPIIPWQLAQTVQRYLP